MSDLLPNLDALLDELPGTALGFRDAQQLAEAVAPASSMDEVDQGLLDVIASWRTT